MPYKSDAQRKFFNANRKEMEAQGVNVDEYNAASKGMSLPEHVAHMKATKRDTKRSAKRKKSKYDFLKRDKDKDMM